MSAIAAANSSATNAVASLLSNGASSATTDADTTAAKATTSDPAASSASRDPVDTINLSDRAKATLARAKTEQVAADKLAAQVAAAKNPSGKDKATKSTSDDGSQLFDRLSGRAQLQKTAQSSDDRNDRNAISNYLQSLIEAHKSPDGSANSFTQTVTDFITVPTTPQQIDEWYKLDGQSIIYGAQQFPEEAATGIGEAVRNRSITILNAKDIPGLNFSNTVTFQAGVGASANGHASYNKDAAIFKDPTTSYRVNSNGTVIAWKTPQAST
jgi:hypothetical protein